MRSNKILKIEFINDIRRVPYVDGNFDQLVNLISELYRIKKSSFKVKYMDDEGDLVTIGSQIEFEAALNFLNSNLIRLKVQETEDHNNRRMEKCKGCGKCKNKEKKQVKSEAIKKNQSLSHHICDGCDKKIEGQRYHCKDCSNFDFCSTCHHNKSKDHNIMHRFEIFGAKNQNEEKEEHNAFCDRCKQTIVGIRWKCLDCNEFDFCNSCYLASNEKEQFFSHLPTHAFAKINNPSSFSQDYFHQKSKHLQEKERIQKEKQENRENQVKSQQIERGKQIQDQPKEKVIKIEEKEFSTPSPKYHFGNKLEDLNTMGFTDRFKNIRALIYAKGDIIVAIQNLLDSN